jgi:putative FmdB family regulatory protein
MPIYEYRCRGCGGDFEKYMHSAATAVACPVCTSGEVSRKLSVFGLRSDGSPVASTVSSGGGCCGGGCACH